MHNLWYTSLPSPYILFLFLSIFGRGKLKLENTTSKYRLVYVEKATNRKKRWIRVSRTVFKWSNKRTIYKVRLTDPTQTHHAQQSLTYKIKKTYTIRETIEFLTKINRKLNVPWKSKGLQFYIIKITFHCFAFDIGAIYFKASNLDNTKNNDKKIVLYWET